MAMNKMTFDIIPGILSVNSYDKTLYTFSGFAEYKVTAIEKAFDHRVVLAKTIGKIKSLYKESYVMPKFLFTRVPAKDNDLIDEDYIELDFKIKASKYYINKAKESKFLIFRFVDRKSKFEYFAVASGHLTDVPYRTISLKSSRLQYKMFEGFETICDLFEASAPDSVITMEIMFSNIPTKHKNGPCKEHVPIIKNGLREVKRLPNVLKPGVIYKRQGKKDVEPRYFIKDGDKIKEISSPEDKSAI